jgi:hypothetical protein
MLGKDRLALAEEQGRVGVETVVYVFKKQTKCCFLYETMCAWICVCCPYLSLTKKQDLGEQQHGCPFFQPAKSTPFSMPFSMSPST